MTFQPPRADTVSISRHLIPRHELIPNTSIQNKPLLIYHQAFSPDTQADDIESYLRQRGVVEPSWRATMFATDHFHSNTAEVLVVIRGRAKLCFGGTGNPEKVEAVVQKGDAMIVPAGVAHRLLEDLSAQREGAAADRTASPSEGGSFEMIGSYPPGKEWDMCYGRPGEEASVQQIKSLGWFERDPILEGGGVPGEE